jgi:hypothetical protein
MHRGVTNAGHRPSNGAQRAIERELAETECADVGAQLPARAKDAQSDRKLEPGPFLAPLRRREIDGDPAKRELESGVADRRADALASLLDRGIRQTDDDKSRQAVRNVDLDGYERRLEAPERARGDARDRARGRWPVPRADRDDAAGCKSALEGAMGLWAGTAVPPAPAD